MENMTRVYKDEDGHVITMWDLLEAYEAGESEAESFGAYVWNCQSHQGGTLEEVHNYAVAKGFARFRVLRYSREDWRELVEVDSIDEAARYIAGLI